VAWAIEQGIETATFHILTPYPGTVLYDRIAAQGRLRHQNWDFYDTRHAVFQPARMSTAVLEQGYWQAYKDFYRWGSIFNSASTKADWKGKLRHLGYAGGWKKFEPMWDWVIRFKQVGHMLPLLEIILTGWKIQGLVTNSEGAPGEKLETAVTPKLAASPSNTRAI
jgi:radical SAM superfamily enzyme YgiQ (UPF0313 family)